MEATTTPAKIREGKEKGKDSFEEAMDAWDKALIWARTGELPVDKGRIKP